MSRSIYLYVLHAYIYCVLFSDTQTAFLQVAKDVVFD
jgi:hypothetical protein